MVKSSSSETLAEDKASKAAHTSYTPDEEKRVVRKLDRCLLSYLCVLYGLAYLDRNAFGNAKNAGMTRDVEMTDNQWLWLNTIYYIAFMLTQWFCLCWKLLPPKRYVPLFIMGWGLASSLMGVANWQGMMVIRASMGACESAFTTVSYYLTMFYYRKEMKRIGWYMAIAPLSASVSGLLGYAITSQITAYKAWKVLFLVQGVPVFVAGIYGFWGLPTDINGCWFLTQRQKDIGNARSSRQLGIVSRDDQHKLAIPEALKVLFSPMMLLTGVIAFCYNASFGFVTFFPQVLRDIGFTGALAQAMVAPPYLLSVGVIVIGSYLSDRFMQRGVFLFGYFALGAIGFLLMALCTSSYVRYFGVYLVSMGCYATVAIMLTWVGSIYGTDTKRSVGFACMAFIGQSGPILGSRIYKQDDGYESGLWISFGLMCVGALTTLTLRILLAQKNRQLDRRFGKVATNQHDPNDSIALEGEANPNFRFVL